MCQCKFCYAECPYASRVINLSVIYVKSHFCYSECLYAYTGYRCTECHNAECRFAYQAVILSVIMHSVESIIVVLSVFMHMQVVIVLSVIMLSVVLLIRLLC